MTRKVASYTSFCVDKRERLTVKGDSPVVLNGLSSKTDKTQLFRRSISLLATEKEVWGTLLKASDQLFGPTVNEYREGMVK